MQRHTALSHDEWILARKTLLTKEKEFTALRDSLSKARRELPWERVEKNYFFDGLHGTESLSDLFDGRSQLIVYHFMLGPGWEQGCKSCSFLADHFNPAIVHLNHRDVTMIAVSRAQITEIEAFQKRMGWTFKWVSSCNNDFNRDYNVSFSQEEVDSGKVLYNYRNTDFPSTEAPGVSVFFKDNKGELFHTYSSYERGLDMFISAYHYLDVVPKGRDEEGLSYAMDWVRHHDNYED